MVKIANLEVSKKPGHFRLKIIYCDELCKKINFKERERKRERN